MSANSENNEVCTEEYAKIILYTILNKVPLVKDCERYREQQLKAKTIINIPNWLKDCEYPFLWCSQEKRGLGPDCIIKWCRQKIFEMTSEEFDLTLTWFVCYLTLVMEHCLLGEMEEAWAFLRKVETTIELETNKSDCFCQKYKVSVDHMMYATKAHLLSVSGQEDMSQQVSKVLASIDIRVCHPLPALSGETEGGSYPHPDDNSLFPFASSGAARNINVQNLISPKNQAHPSVSPGSDTAPLPEHTRQLHIYSIPPKSTTYNTDFGSRPEHTRQLHSYSIPHNILVTALTLDPDLNIPTTHIHRTQHYVQTFRSRPEHTSLHIYSIPPKSTTYNTDFGSRPEHTRQLHSYSIPHNILVTALTLDPDLMQIEIGSSCCILLLKSTKYS
ncbi:hypothetical protein J6590_001020 [Homalodisca vitripennis]|nr:hypothetical protein J6590_001020 [Homalodisca vitripennis]